LGSKCKVVHESEKKIIPKLRRVDNL